MKNQFYSIRKSIALFSFILCLHSCAPVNSIYDNAKLIGAVNTIKNKGGILKGYNTDGRGFVKSILDKGYEAVFQVRVTPVANYTNQAIPIIGETSLRAIDAFTGKAIEKIISPVMSNQLTDKTVFSDQGIVKP